MCKVEFDYRYWKNIYFVYFLTFKKYKYAMFKIYSEQLETSKFFIYF